MVASIEEAHWDVLRRLGAVTDERRDRAQSLLGRLSEAWVRDELSDSLVTALPEVERQAVDLLTVTPPPPPPPPPPADRHERTVPASEVSGVLAEIREAAAGAGDSRITISWTVER